jgi:UDP-N-acetylglucosamine 2-epimerase (non-hydrolysing)
MRPVALALLAQGVAPSLVFTGQHAGLEPGAFGLGEFPALRLDCPGREDPHDHVREVTTALLPVLRDMPDLVVVQGDTSSALGGALAAFMAGVPVAHVEAGLRTHDPLLPWPEEEYRSAIDAHAELLFAPTELAADNLRSEQVPGEIYVTGNTAIDAVLEVMSRLPPPGSRDRLSPHVLVTCHRRESWHDGLGSIAAALRELAGAGVDIEFVLHPNSFVASNMRRLLGGTKGICLTEPCSHAELIQRIRDADLVLSDSGGMQEEAPALGVPLLVLREKTERPEGIAAGTALLVGTDRDRIGTEVRRLLHDPETRAAMSRQAFPFGDGTAGMQIATTIMEWLDERIVERRLA